MILHDKKGGAQAGALYVVVAFESQGFDQVVAAQVSPSPPRPRPSSLPPFPDPVQKKDMDDFRQAQATAAAKRTAMIETLQKMAVRPPRSPLPSHSHSHSHPAGWHHPLHRPRRGAGPILPSALPHQQAGAAR